MRKRKSLRNNTELDFSSNLKKTDYIDSNNILNKRHRTSKKYFEDSTKTLITTEFDQNFKDSLITANNEVANNLNDSQNKNFFLNKVNEKRRSSSVKKDAIKILLMTLKS